MNLFTYAGLIAFALLVSWTLHSPIAFGFAVALFVVALLAVRTSRAVPGTLLAQRDVAETLVPAGSVVTHRVRVVAQGRYGFRWLVLKDACPESLSARGATGLFTVGVPRAGAEWMYRTELPTRGIYQFGPVLARSGDLFGLGVFEWEAEGITTISVHPRLVPVAALDWPSYRPFGGMRANRTVFDDPTRPAGTRDYAQGDPLRRIHWAASARAGRLIAKEYDGSRVPLAVLVVDRNPTHYAQTSDYELAFTAAASLLAQGSGEGYDIGLALETLLLPDIGQAHLEKALFLLAAATSTEQSLTEQLASVYGQIPWLASVLVITSKLEPKDAMALEVFRRDGHATVLLLVGTESYLESALQSAGMACTAFGRIRNEEELGTLCFVAIQA